MRCLVTGSTGLVGRALVSALLQQNYVVIEAGRRSMGDANLSFVDVGHISSTTNWSDALQACDIVFHLAARVHVMKDHVENPLAAFQEVNNYGTINLARQAAHAGAKRFIYISSVKVNGEQTPYDRPYSETDLPAPQDDYGISKFEAEEGLLETAKNTGMEVVIIRPPLIYGPGVKANFASLVNALKQHLPLPLGAIYNKRSFIYVGNLVDFLLKCIDHPAAANQTFLVSDGQDLSTTELLKACGKALNIKVWLLPVPQFLIVKLASLIGKKSIAQRLCGNLQVDISKSRQLMGWNPPISVIDGLKATFEKNETFF